ncbi:MAG TPA: hypothetical protein VEB64_13175 [Azospirillaceae bacterium]|nr:hypothetical protein [Azospirillaceae bacterium]
MAKGTRHHVAFVNPFPCVEPMPQEDAPRPADIAPDRPAARSKAEERQERLAAQLRDNLRKRKERARALGDGPGDESSGGA